MLEQLEESLGLGEPPRELSKPLQALWWIKKGQFLVGPEWDMAHNICVAGEGQSQLDLVHALLHWIEADMGNADYWYRRAGMRRSKPTVASEWTYIVEMLGD